jgi:hypothetical protein
VADFDEGMIEARQDDEWRPAFIDRLMGKLE